MRHVPHHNALANTITIDDAKGSTYLTQYNLQGGNDKLEITGSLQDQLSIYILQEAVVTTIYLVSP